MQTASHLRYITGETCCIVNPSSQWFSLKDAGRPIRSRKGEFYYREAFPAEGVFLLCTGSVSLRTTTLCGTERILDIVTPGELFGLDAMLQTKERFFSAVAREPTEARFFRTLDFVSLLSSDISLLWNFTLTLNHLVHRANRGKLSVSGSRVRDRIEHVLSDLNGRRRAQLVGNQTLPGFASVKQRELAELVGVPQETICREMRFIADRITQPILSIAGQRRSKTGTNGTGSKCSES